MDVWFEYEYSLSGELLSIEIRYYLSDTAPEPFLTDHWSYSLTVRQDLRSEHLRTRLYNRVRAIEGGIEAWTEINGALDAGQNTRLNAESVVG